MSEAEAAVAYQHIAAFYGGVNSGESQKWLSEFSKSVIAWQICDRILCERRDPLACCFAAQTIRQKILKSLSEIPEASYLSLRESLINHLSVLHPAAGDSLGESTLTQLCLSIADLYIQVPQWNNWIVELLNKCTSLEGDRTRMMLTLLRVFPEEMQTVKVGENRRKVIRDELAASATGVMTYLTQVLEKCHSDEELVKRILICVGAYLTNPAMSTDQVATSPLMTAAFQIVALPNVSSPLHDAATESIVSAVILAEDQNAHLALCRAVQAAIYNLVEPFQIAVAHDDMDKLQNFARIFTELNESLLEKFINEPTTDVNSLGSLNSLELLLLLAGHHDYSIIEKTFNMWYRISEALFQFDDDDHIAKFRPYVSRYLTALYRHSRFDTDEEGIPDETSDFMLFRKCVVETVKDVVYIVGTDACVRDTYTMLVHCASAKGSWDEMESALFLISAVVHNLVPEEDSIVPELVSAVAGLPPTSHPILIITSIQLLGGCDEWLQKHVQFHDQTMAWLCSLIPNPLFSTHAADSIERIVEKSSHTMSHMIAPLMALIPVLERSNTRGKSMEHAIVGIIKSVTTLTMHLSEPDIHKNLAQLCEPIVQRLQAILSSTDVANANKENEASADSWSRIGEEPMLWVDRIAAIFKEVKPWQKLSPAGASSPAPWLDIATALYQVLSAALSKYEAKERMVEHICRSIRHLIRSLGLQSQVFVGPVVQQIMDIYPRHQHSCFLYLASVLVDEYGAIAETRSGLMEMVNKLATVTFQFFMSEGDTRIKMRDNPDMVDDLFRLASRFILRAPSTFFLHPIAVPLFDCALSALNLDHMQANRAVTRFFTDLIEQLLSAKRANYRDEGVTAAEQLLMAKGSLLVTAALNAALFEVNGTLRRDMAEIICMLGKYDAVHHRKWLEAATNQLPRGGLAATDVQLVQFVKNLTENPSQMNTRDVNNQIRELTQLYN